MGFENYEKNNHFQDAAVFVGLIIEHSFICICHYDANE